MGAGGKGATEITEVSRLGIGRPHFAGGQIRMPPHDVGFSGLLLCNQPCQTTINPESTFRRKTIT